MRKITKVVQQQKNSTFSVLRRLAHTLITHSHFCHLFIAVVPSLYANCIISFKV